jgi:Cu+-exporting ATPase
MSVEKALKETGFGEVNVNLEDKSVEFDLSGKTLEQAVAAIEAKGYDVEV